MMNEPQNSPEPGLYKHYKGGEYRVVGMVRHSETEEWLVYYQCMYGDFGFWVRPLNMFNDTVLVNGKEVKRFQRA